MYIPRLAGNVMILAVLTVLLACGGIWADTSINKPEVLHQLTRTSVSQLPARGADLYHSYPEAVTQLHIDLVVYRWIARSLAMPGDIRNLDSITASLARSIGGPVVNHAASLFLAGSHGGTALRPSADDTTLRSLDLLKEHLVTALASRESSPAKAVESFAAAARVSQEVGLDLSGAALSKELGDIHHYDMARYRQAESFYDRASTTFQVYRAAAASAAVYDAWGMLSMTTGRYSDSAERYTQSARQWEELVREDPSQFRDRDRAGLAYIRAGKAREASGDYPGALELMRSRGLFHLRNWAYATKSHDLLVKNLMTVATFVRERMNDPKDAVALLNEARDAAIAQNDPLLQARVYDDLAKTYSLIKSPNAAAALTKKARSLTDAAAKGDEALAKIAAQPGMARPTLVGLLVQIERAAVACRELGQAEKSAELLRKAADTYGASGLVDEQVSALRSLAATLDEMKKPGASLEVRQEAVAIARKTGRNSLATDIVMSIIRTFREQNETQNALEGLNELVPLAMSTRNSRQEAEALEARASLLVQLNHHKDAIGDYRAALDRFTTAVGDTWAAGRIALALAEAQTVSGQASEARTTLANALSNIEAIYGLETYRSSAYPEHTRVVIDLYRKLIENDVRAKDKSGALAVVRRSLRYPWFPDMMRDMRNSSDPLVSEFAQSSDLLHQDPDIAQPPGSSVMLARNEPEYVTTCWKVQQNSSANYAAMPVDPLDIFRARAAIPKGTLVIAYMQTDFCVFAWICARDRSEVWQLDRASVDESVRKLRRSMEYCEQGVNTGVPVPPMTDWQSPAFAEIRGPLMALYDKLIAPISQSLDGSERLVFALPREFEALPLGALISGDTKGSPVFLVQSHQISYLARGMLGDLASEKSRQIYPNLDSLAIFADPEDNLPGARKEAAIIRSTYPNSRLYVGSERATASSFLAECVNAGILHVAAHHRLSSNPYGFEIVLAPNATSKGIVGIENLAVLRSESLEMVVLAACDTVGSSNPISTGPARAAEMFSLIGAKSVLGSLWKVSDDAGAEVFREFYKNLSKGNSRAESLRLAQLSMIESKRFAHPFYWACFALYGNPR